MLWEYSKIQSEVGKEKLELEIKINQSDKVESNKKLRNKNLVEME